MNVKKRKNSALLYYYCQYQYHSKIETYSNEIEKIGNKVTGVSACLSLFVQVVLFLLMCCTTPCVLGPFHCVVAVLDTKHNFWNISELKCSHGFYLNIHSVFSRISSVSKFCCHKLLIPSVILNVSGTYLF